MRSLFLVCVLDPHLSVQTLTGCLVSRMLGKDIWNLHPDDITDFLYVSLLPIVSKVAGLNGEYSYSFGTSFSTWGPCQ